MANILVTGATGFIGRRLLAYLYQHGHKTRAAIRRPSSAADVPGDSVVVGEIDADTDWSRALGETEVIVHLAARVHVMHETEDDPLTAFRKVNTEGTIKLAESAAAAGVKRLVYLSSIKVNGEETHGQAFKASDESNIPTDPYGQSKWETEQALKEVSKRTGLELVIIRPPLVYGPGVKANFLSLIKLIKSGLPLPLGSIKNRRTMVALDNLVDLIKLCCEHPAAAGRVFLAADDESVSTAELLEKIAQAFGKKPHLISIPEKLMSLMTKLIGKKEVWRRLAGSLEVDNSEAKQLLGWQPVTSMSDELKRIAVSMQK
ncbi:MAG: SDR family oxidoreductase [Gammaproteobacteria bacterium]|nr:SDR family oxidoreductase [Gammaproteobacteria bacterium]